MLKTLQIKASFAAVILAFLFPFFAEAQCPITTFPHTENFDAVTAPALPCGWTVINVNNDPNTWITGATANANSAPNALAYPYNTAAAADDWAFTPSIAMVAGRQYVVTFRYRVHSGTFPEALEVKHGNAATIAAMTSTIFTNSNLTNTTYATATATINPTATGTQYIGFHVMSPADMWNLYIDDFSISELTACSGTPVAGTVPASPMGICAGNVNTITASGATQGVGIAYQWEQSASASGPWANVTGGSGATTTSYTLPTTLTATTFYRLKVTCSGNNPVYTSAVQVTINPPVTCYCNTNLHTVACSATDNIDAVVIAGTTLNNVNTGCSATNGMGYTSYAASGATTATLQRSVTYSFSVTSTANSILSVWIDYNQNGSFEASEWQQIATTSTPGAAVTVPVTIPNSAVLGQTGMRIRSRFSGNANGAGDACTAMGSGETEDYIITIGAAPTCTTPVTAGSISGNQSLCTGGSTTLTLSGQTLGTALQWQSSPNGTAWTNVTGATSSVFTTPALTSTTFYRVNVTCGTSTVPTSSYTITVGNGAITSFPHTENFDAVTAPALPCGWTVINVNNDPNTWITGATANANSAPNALAYPYNTAAAADDWAFTPSIAMVAGRQYVVTFRYRVHNGTYPEALEVKHGNAATIAAMTSTIFTNSNLTNTTYATATATINPTATGTQYIGFHVMSQADMWNLYIDDFSISELTACSGTPVAGTVPASPMGICAGNVNTITATGATQGVGIAYQWEQSASASGPLANVTGGSGAATTSYILPTTLTATTFYRLKVTCSGNNPVYTSAVQVTINPPVACYCNTNLHTVACSATDNIDAVVIAGTTLNNINTGCSATNGMGYTSYAASGATTATLNRNATYNLNVTSTAISILSVWIDYNQNGSFEASEWQQIATTTTAGSPATLAITIPSTAVLGQTGMRIRSRFSGNANGAGDACTAMGSGETEDYIITIGAGCAPAATPTVTAGGPTTFCTGGSVTLTATSTTTGATFQWRNNSSPIPGATGATYNATTAGAYTVVATDPACPNAPSAASAATTVTVNQTPTPVNIVGNSYCKNAAAVTLSGGTTTYTVDGIPATTFNPATLAVGPHTVVASQTVNGCTGTTSKTVTIVATPATPTISAAGFVLTSSASGGNQWYLNGNAIANATGTTHTAVVNGTYTVVSTVGGCASATSAGLVINNVGISKNMEGRTITVYPNPTNGQFEVKLNGFTKDASIALYNLTGQLIATETVKGNAKESVKKMNIANLATGVYLLKVTSETSVQVTRLTVE